MSNDYFIGKSALTLAMIVIAGIIYLLGKKLSFLSKYSGVTRFVLSMIYSGVIGLLVFYPPAILDAVYGVGNEYVTGMALIFIPICLIVVVVSLLVFLFKILVKK